MRDGGPPGGTSLRRVRADFSRSRRTGRESETSLSVSRKTSQKIVKRCAFCIYETDRLDRAYSNDVGRISRLDYTSEKLGPLPCVRLSRVTDVMSHRVVLPSRAYVSTHVFTHMSHRKWVRYTKQVMRDWSD